MTLRAVVVGVLILGLLPRIAEAEPVIEERIHAALRIGVSPDGRPWPQVDGDIAVPVTLTLETIATPALLASLEQAPGLTLRWVEGRPMHRGRLVPALVTARGLVRLVRRQDVRRVSAGAVRGPVRPLDHTTALVGVGAARRTWVGDHALAGHGVLLADIDSSVEIFHPDFFAADGGAYDWIDVDGDGGLTPGVDAVDLDGDGEVGEDEVLGVLSAVITDFSTVDSLPARPEGFSAAWDWIYVDANSDGERDFGPNEGFDDDTPAFGEPLFVVDDLDHDDALGVDERLFRLETSRIPAVFIVYPEGGTRVYRRGVDLIDLPDAPFGYGAYDMPEAMHATGVVSIVAGGVPHMGRTMTGFAPEAEVIVVYNGGWDFETGVIWALGEGADVMIHEYAPWVGVTLDGSDPLSELIDDSTGDDGVIHVCPVGNTGGSRKHTMADVAPGAEMPLSLDVPTGWGFSYVGVSLHWMPPAEELHVDLVAPSGERHDIIAESAYFSLDGADAYASYDVTPAGTAMIHLSVFGWIPEGVWVFELTNGAGETVTVHGYVTDEISGWGEGVAWDAAIASDVSNIGLPSTAEACLAVGATTGHVGSDEERWFLSPEGEAAGELRIYSGRGPRIDGLQKPDLVAPDNPFAAFPRWSDFSIGLGTYWVYGGTSGAGPHVAGAAVLMVQSGPPGGGQEVIDLLLSGAASDELTGDLPNYDYGYGRVSLEGALGVSTTGAPPLLTLEAPSPAAPGETARVVATVNDPDGDPALAEIRWDVGYDGGWETGFGAIEEQLVEVPIDAADGQRFPVRAEVRDVSGLVDRAALWISIETIESDADADGDIDADSDNDADVALDADGRTDLDAENVDPGDASSQQVFSAGGGGCQCRVAEPGAGRQIGSVRAALDLVRSTL